jgi:phosphatidylserine/phosphatidylglycerophosphate/cardiolipin synthase-like enzyme
MDGRAPITVQTLLPVNILRRPLSRFDIRNHRKLAIIDGAIGYTGSQNIHAPDRELDHPGVWQQIMVRLTGPAVLQLQLVPQSDAHAIRKENTEERELGELRYHVIAMLEGNETEHAAAAHKSNS